MSARTRTMAHLAKMLALAATSCSHEQAEPQAVTLPTPSSTATASSTASAPRTLAKPPPLNDDDTTMTLRHPMHGSDPVGPPPQQYCVGVAATVNATAAMRRGPSGDFEVEVHVTLPASSGATFPHPAQVVAYGAIVLSESITATQAVFRGRLNMIADKANVRVFLPITCPPGTGSLEVDVFYDRTAGTVKVDRIESR